MGFRIEQWPWYALLVRANRERTATLFLEHLGYPCYLPVGKFTRRWSDRWKEVEVPLFPGYLFCRMNPENRLPILMTPGLIQIVGVGKTPLPVDEQEITAIQRAATTGISIIPWTYMKVGHVARIEEGPLKGLTGIVVKIKSAMKLVLSVSLLQRSVAIEIDRSWIGEPFEPIPDENAIAIKNSRPKRLGSVGIALNAKESRLIGAMETD
jgi:transcription antitermination factor NusG